MAEKVVKEYFKMLVDNENNSLNKMQKGLLKLCIDNAKNPGELFSIIVMYKSIIEI